MKNKTMIRSKVFILFFVGMLSMPFATFAQQQEDDHTDGYEVPELEAPESSGGAVTPLNGNEEVSSGGSLGIQDPRGGSTANNSNGPFIGSTMDDRDPGGNPDVPFDPVMNLVFLCSGLVFAYFISRRQFNRKFLRF